MAKESNATIARAILARLDVVKDRHQLTRALASYLIEERRIGDSRAIMRELEGLLLVRDGTLYVHVTTAYPLNSDQKNAISQIFTKKANIKNIIIEETIDEAVIGGVRCETVDSRLDLTVRRQLQQLKSQTA
ncbi:ATP synthase F1 subunit delta [Candidatus Saccharibacteria bacterium]|nr:ATP synthase F1 subunit delta [Candidatus Saccharibacteria bacterium]